MPRPRGRRPAPPRAERADADTDTDPRFLAAWGLEPAQWRPVGSMAAVRRRAVLIWHLDGANPAEDVALRARRAYDRLGELGVTVSADATPRGIEVMLPLGRLDMALKTLGEWAILPNVACVDDVPADQLRQLRRDIAAWRGRVALEIGTHEESDPVAELRARVRLT